MGRKAIILLCSILLISGCGKSGSSMENEAKVKTEVTEKVESYIEENGQFFVNELNVGVTGAKGAAQILEGVGCKKLVKIEELEDDGKSYRMTVQDEEGNKFILTMGYDGYLGIVQDMKGNYLYTPVD